MFFMNKKYFQLDLLVLHVIYQDHLKLLHCKSSSSRSIVARHTLFPSPVDMSIRIITSRKILQFLVLIMYICENNWLSIASCTSYLSLKRFSGEIEVSHVWSDMFSYANNLHTDDIHQFIVHP